MLAWGQGQLSAAGLNIRPRETPAEVRAAPWSAGPGMTLRGALIDAPAPPPQALALPQWQLAHPALAQLGDILPWYAHNALVHYLSPRGLEQYSGGGWGTRDVCQGPLEMLLALGRTAPVRDLLLRVFSAQNPDGDWPQWFMTSARSATSSPSTPAS